MRRLALALGLALAGCELRPPPEPPPAPEPAVGEPAAGEPAPRPEPVAAPDAAPATPPDANVAAASAAQFKACTDAATHTVDVMIAAAPKVNQPELLAQRDEVIAGMRDPCVMRQWSPQMLSCLNAATDQKAIEACRALLPP